MNNKYVSIIVVATLIIAGIGVILYSNSNNERDIIVTDRLVVYGNANNDDYIDSYDRSIIQNIVDGKETWNKMENPFADTNADGKISSDDLALLDKIINKTKCTVYYLDRWDDAVAVDYPLTGTIGTMYYQQAEISILLGLWEDRVTACGTVSLNDIKNPGYANKFSYGNGYNVDPELVIESGVETIICYTQTNTTAPDMKALIASTGAKLNILCINHESLLKCVVTYGFLFDVTEISQKYTEYADKGTEIIQESMKNIPTEDQPSVAIVMLYGSASTDKIRVLGYNSDTTKNSHNLGKLMNSVPNANWVRADLESPSYGTYVTSEWFLENQPDYIIVAGSGIGATSDMSFEEVYQVFFNKCKEVFGETEAFKNGNIVATSNGLTNGYSMHLISPKLLSMVYDEIDDDLSNEIYNSWYDDFTLYKVEDCPNEMIFYVNKS